MTSPGGASVGSAWVSVLPDLKNFSRDLTRQVSTVTGQAGTQGGKDFGDNLEREGGKRTRGFASTVTKTIGAAFLAVGATRMFGNFIADAEESAKVARLTENAIRATGGAANVSASDVDRLSTSLSNKSGIDDETIQSGANLILTFKNIRNEVGEGNDVFDRTTQAALDLSAAGFGSVESASLQLGKALNDPIAGMSALSRSGVTFTEQQKEQIKTLVESGDLLSAQRIILDEVASQVGGAAEAAASPIEKLKTVAGNLGEAVGTFLLPILTATATFLVDTAIPAFFAVTGFIGDNSTAFLIAAGSLGALFAITKLHTAFLAVQAVGGIAAYIAATGIATAFASTWAAAQWLLNGAVAFLTSPIGIVVVAIGALVAAFVVAWNKSETFRDIVTGAWKAITDAFTAGWNWIRDKVFAPFRDFMVNTLGPVLKWLWNQVVVPVFSGIQNTISAAWDNVIKPVLGALWDFVQNVLGPVLMWLWNQIVVPVFGGIVSVIQVAWGVISPVLSALWDFIANVLGPVLMWLWNNVAEPVFGGIRNVISAAWDFIKPIFIFLGDAIGVVGGIFESVGGWIARTWQSVTDALAGGWWWIRDNVFAPLAAVFDTVGRAFESFGGMVGRIWDGLLTGMRVVYDRVLTPMWNTLVDAIKWVQWSFGQVVEGIRWAWNNIMGIAAWPINFIIEVVFNKGLFAAWNWLNEQLGLGFGKAEFPQIRGAGIHNFASGGVTEGQDATGGGRVRGKDRGPRADNVLALVTPDEFVVQRPIATRTKDFLGALNAGVPGALAVADSWRNALPYYATGGQIFGATKAAFPRAKLNSGYRAGDSGYHGRDMAADMGEEGFPGGSGRSYIADMKRWWYDNFGKTAEEIIYTGQWNNRPNVKNGADLNYSSAVNAGHKNHLHVAESGAIAGAVGGGERRGTGGTFEEDKPWWEDLWDGVTGAWDWLKDSIKDVGQMASKFGGQPYVKAISGVPGKMLGGVWDYVKGFIGGLFSGESQLGRYGGRAGPGTQMAGIGGTPKAAVQSYAKDPYGWTGGQWDALDWLVNKESSWNPTAQNAVSTASGLFQHIDSTWRGNRPSSASGIPKMRLAGINDQSYAGLRYISKAYGDPVGAKQFHQSKGWYDEGGWLPPGLSSVYNGTGRPEAVLNPDQWDSLSRGGREYHVHIGSISERRVAEAAIERFRDLEVLAG